jgi:hypothetical protein
LLAVRELVGSGLLMGLVLVAMELLDSKVLGCLRLIALVSFGYFWLQPPLPLLEVKVSFESGDGI